jgi:hypothetical protein
LSVPPSSLLSWQLSSYAKSKKSKSGDPFTNKNPSYQIAFYIQHSGLEWCILTNGRLWRLYHKHTAHKLDHYYEVDVPKFTQWLDTAATIANQRRFFHWELEFPEVFFDKYGQPKKGQAGFDAVVGNPPWIRQEAFSEDKAALKRLFRVYHGVADLSTYFVELGNTYLKNGGHFGFIIPNKFVRANYGEPLRTFLTEQVCLERLVDFGDLPVFRDATTYPITATSSLIDADLCRM